MSLVKRLLSPAGFLLVLGLFLLPFVTVSCETGVGEIRADYSGVDVATGARPLLVIPPEVEQMRRDLAEAFEDIGPPGEESKPVEPTKMKANSQLTPPAGTVPQVLVIAVAAVALAGLLAGFLPALRRRQQLTAATAGLAVVLLVAAEIVAQQNVTARIMDSAMEDIPGSADRINAVLPGLVGSGFGFWLQLLVLLLVGLGAILALTASRWRPYFRTWSRPAPVDAEGDPP